MPFENRRPSTIRNLNELGIRAPTEYKIHCSFQWVIATTKGGVRLNRFYFENNELFYNKTHHLFQWVTDMTRESVTSSTKIPKLRSGVQSSSTNSIFPNGNDIIFFLQSINFLKWHPCHFPAMALSFVVSIYLSVFQYIC